MVKISEIYLEKTGDFEYLIRSKFQVTENFKDQVERSFALYYENNGQFHRYDIYAKDITNNFRSLFLLKAVNEINRSIDEAIVESIIRTSKGVKV